MLLIVRAHFPLSRVVVPGRYALVWGRSSKHSPQRCGVAHELADEDVVQLVKKKNVITGELRGRFKQTSSAPLRISDREKKAKLKT